MVQIELSIAGCCSDFVSVPASMPHLSMYLRVSIPRAATAGRWREIPFGGRGAPLSRSFQQRGPCAWEFPGRLLRRRRHAGM